MNEGHTSFDWLLNGGPAFVVLLALFFVWVVFALLILKRRTRPSALLLTPFVVLPLCLIAGSLIYFFALSMMLTDTLGTTGGEVAWIQAHIAIKREIIGRSALIAALGLFSGVIGWSISILLFCKSLAEGRR